MPAASSRSSAGRHRSRPHGAGLLALGLAMLASPAHAAGLPPLQEVVERSEILDRLATALVAFDNRDFESFIAAFTPDGAFVVVDPDPKRNLTVPKTGLAAEFAHLPSGPPGELRHYTSNLSVVFADPTHARLHGYYVLMHREAAPTAPPGAGGGPPGSGPGGRAAVVPLEMGSYDSRLVKVDGRWMFAEYRVLNAGTGPSPLE